MTDRVNSLVVVLKEDWRTDEVERVMNAILMIGPVLSVTPNISDYAEHVAERRANRKWMTRIYAMMKEAEAES